MCKNIFLIFFLLRTQCACYNNSPPPQKRKCIEDFRNNLQTNIEIYESINECNVSDIMSCGGKCIICMGTGLVICQFCHGTGFLTIGDTIIGTRNNCTACMGRGEKECVKCMGSGYIAKWRKKLT